MDRLCATAAALVCLAVLPRIAYAAPHAQAYAPMGGSWVLSDLFAALPLAVLFLLLGSLRLPVTWAADAALNVLMPVELAAYGRPASQVASSALRVPFILLAVVDGQHG